MDHVMTGIEDILGHHGNHHLRDKYDRFSFFLKIIILAVFKLFISKQINIYKLKITGYLI